MRQDEAERLAREIKRRSDISYKGTDVEELCDYILSGDHKREIENAAFEHAVRIVDLKVGNFFNREETKEALRALIQPPAQKENGE